MNFKDKYVSEYSQLLNKQNFVINILSYCAAANGETVLFLLFPASVAPNDKIKYFKKRVWLRIMSY